jgi:predicted peptidase
LLRALGYDDSQGDFSWSSANEFIYEKGIISEDYYNDISANIFLRDHMAKSSYDTLLTEVDTIVNNESSKLRLINKLAYDGKLNNFAVSDFVFFDEPEQVLDTTGDVLEQFSFQGQQYNLEYELDRTDSFQVLTRDSISSDEMNLLNDHPQLSEIKIEDIKGTTLHVEPYNDILLDWYIHIPEDFAYDREYSILVTGLHGDFMDDYEKTMRNTEGQVTCKSLEMSSDNYIVVGPAIYRENRVYSVSFDRKMYYNSSSYNDYQLYPEEQLVLIHNMVNAYLVDNNVKVKDGMFLEGFSAGGMFAQRFALIYPEKVRAIAAGSPGGGITMPLEQYENIEPHWPIGINDYEFMFNKEFDIEEYKAIPQLLYIGNGDTAPEMSTIRRSNLPPLFFDESEVYWLMDTFGETAPTVIENQVSYLNEIGFNNLVFHTYASDGHAALNISSTEKFFNIFD